MAITNIKERGNALMTKEYTLPGWEPGEDFVCRLRKPTLVGMLNAVGFVPNPLIQAVNDMFLQPQRLDKVAPEQQAKAMHAMAKYALLEPTFDQLTEAGLELTDSQYMAIYAFALQGAEGLDRFRARISGQPGGDGDSVQHEAVEPTGDP